MGILVTWKPPPSFGTGKRHLPEHNDFVDPNAQIHTFFVILLPALHGGLVSRGSMLTNFASDPFRSFWVVQHFGEVRLVAAAVHGTMGTVLVEGGA